MPVRMSATDFQHSGFNMSCDAAASLAFLWLASTSPMSPTAISAQPVAVSHEPLFVDIVRKAGKLKSAMRAFQGNDKPLPATLKVEVDALSALDMKGHLTLAKRGTDGDLKCILRGISQDLPVKYGAVVAAADRKSRDAALKEMTYLLTDNVEVITAPPKPAV